MPPTYLRNEDNLIGGRVWLEEELQKYREGLFACMIIIMSLIGGVVFLINK
jgi:hypothetical protein